MVTDPRRSIGEETGCPDRPGLEAVSGVVLLGPDVFFEPLRPLVPATVYHITLIHMVIARGAVTTRLRRKLSEQCEGQCEEGGVAWREGERRAVQR